MATSSRRDLNEKYVRAVCAVVALVVMLSPTTIGATEAPVDEVPATEPAAEPATVDSGDPASQPVPDAPADEPDQPRPPVTANEFFPEERDVTSCIGVLERPGCGSEQRGGWRQTLTFGAVFVGLAIVFGNVIRGVRKRSG